MRNTSFLMIALSVALAGCVSTSKVGVVDRDTYVISSSSTSVLVGNQDLLLDSAEKARLFCDERGKEMVQAADRFIESGVTRRQIMFYFRCV